MIRFINIVNNIIGNLFLVIAYFRVNKNMLLKQNFYLLKTKIDSMLESDLPDKIIKSVVIIEDRRYFNHLGVDLYAICRAIFKYLTFSRLEGASTIEQQFVRSITNNRQISIKRKIDEICLAVLLSKEYDKVLILSTYLSTYKFNNIIGIEHLCIKENYHLQHISNFEAASIAARLKYPYINEENYVRYLKRVRTIEMQNCA